MDRSMRPRGIKDLSFDVLSFINSPHLSIVPGCSPEAIVCPGREIHSLLAGMSPPIRLLNVSNLSHGGSTHILPTYPAPFQKPSGVKRKAPAYAKALSRQTR